VAPSWNSPPFWSFEKKNTSTIYFLWIIVSKSKISIDLEENWLNYETFVSGGHVEFVHHFVVGGGEVLLDKGH
jgi:IS1 family transposase